MTGSTLEIDRSPDPADRAWGPLYRAGALSACLAVIAYAAALVLVAGTSTPPTTGGARVLQYVDAHRTLYIVRQLLWLAPSLFLMVVFLALAVARRHQGREELRGHRWHGRDRLPGGAQRAIRRGSRVVGYGDRRDRGDLRGAPTCARVGLRRVRFAAVRLADLGRGRALAPRVREAASE